MLSKKNPVRRRWRKEEWIDIDLTILIQDVKVSSESTRKASRAETDHSTVDSTDIRLEVRCGLLPKMNRQVLYWETNKPLIVILTTREACEWTVCQTDTSHPIS